MCGMASGGSTETAAAVAVAAYQLVKSAIVTCHHSNTHTVQRHVQPNPLTHYQRTDLGYSFMTDFHYRLICKLLILAGFSAVVMGVGLYMGRLIHECVRYFMSVTVNLSSQFTVSVTS